jgi:multisubunit Na+/H+ antiporter MnhB subunit
MKKNISRIIGVIMLIVAIVFIVLALNHPEKSFPWNNTITWLLYGIYFLVTVVLLIAPKMKKWEISVCITGKFKFNAWKKEK